MAMKLKALCLGTLLASACSSGSLSGAAASDLQNGGDPTLAVIDTGELRGVVEGNTVSFRGIPYATAPIAALRWAPPQAAASWQGVRDASQFGARCLQQGTDGGAVGQEDCLFLNVWVPNPLPPTPLPIIVFVHGGDWIKGAGSLPGYDGAVLAQAGPAMVVTLNYRLGALGYFALQGLAQEQASGTTGNYGLLDQMAALAWVKRNAHSFGGDSSRVLLWGQSAGAWSTFMHLASPLGRDLFSRAFSESGGTYARPLAFALRQGFDFAAQQGCTGTNVLQCMRGLPKEALLASPTEGVWDPVIDGYVLTEPVMTTFQNGNQNPVPLLMGSTSDEFGLPNMSTTPPVSSIVTEQDYESALTTKFGAASLSAILAQYPSSAYASVQAAYLAVNNDALLSCPNRRLARYVVASQPEPVWRYIWTHTDSSGPFAPYGPVHASDLASWFGNFTGGFAPTTDEQALSAQMVGAVTAFAATGNPNGNGTGVAWPQYDGSTDPYLDLDVPASAAAGYLSAQCDFWDGLPN
jgi:para-nitrobenzyl esterase